MAMVKVGKRKYQVCTLRRKLYVAPCTALLVPGGIDSAKPGTSSVDRLNVSYFVAFDRKTLDAQCRFACGDNFESCFYRKKDRKPIVLTVPIVVPTR
jgi:hypothetical protein